jgi:hypothetical protein
MALHGFTTIEHFTNGIKREAITPALVHQIMQGKLSINVVLHHERFGAFVGFIARVSIKPPRNSTSAEFRAFYARQAQMPLVVVNASFSNYKQIWHLGQDGSVTLVAETSDRLNVNMDVYAPSLAQGLIDWRNYGYCEHNGKALR